MGRPEPCILFAQTFVHPQLDEYVDEVLFAEPIVITACEFLEQNASSASQAVSLVGATSPPSFALEVFVQCEGETRFRRLCQPFLYSHSSSNVLEVEAVVTNHLIVRGSYRSLSLIIYGNTAEDLGQFNIDFDDSSLTNLVTSAEGKLEDLPLALHSINRAIEESITSLNVLSLPVAASDMSTEVKQLLHLMLKVFELPNPESAVHRTVNIVVLAASSLVAGDLGDTTNQKLLASGKLKDCEDDMQRAIIKARKELIELYGSLQHNSAEFGDGACLEAEADMASSKHLVALLSHCFDFSGNSSSVAHLNLPQSRSVILGLSVSLLLCSGRESCFHFVDCGGMNQLSYVFSHDAENSTSIMLLLLGVIEQATRHSIGCEGFLGWWPREDENIPSGISEGYSRLLNLLLQKHHHDVASRATFVLHRLRFYELASRYESAVLSVLGGLSAAGKVTTTTSNMLLNAKSQLQKLLKLINLRGPIEDPSPVSSARKTLTLSQPEGLLSYKVTSNLIASSTCCFANLDIDPHLLTLLKERGFLSLSAALLSSSILRSEVGDAMDVYLDISSFIGEIILSLLFCRSGMIFLLQHSEISATLIHALRGVDDMNKKDCLPLRYAFVLMSKGFVCGPQEVAKIVEMHLRVVNAIDRLLASLPLSEEFLWVLWDLCGVSRSDCGRQALLTFGFFPEALSILIEALHSAKESEPSTKSSGASPLSLAILHSAAEIFEVIVTDSTACSLGSWIGHAMELHKALHSSSSGSNRKDAPTRLLEWIDAGVVYHKNGLVGLLRYAAVLASGGDAHLSSPSHLVSDLMEVENGIGEPSGGSDFNVMENIVKIMSDKSFDGVNLRDSSIAQLTTALRILAFISENSTVAAALYEEGAVTVVYAILVNCRYMLERSSNNYDYLIDDGTECNSSSDLLLERNREQSLVDLLVPSLVLLITLLQTLQETNEQHKNTKLMNALLRLHREVSPKLAACAADLSSSYPNSALGFGAVCHLLVSGLAFWPIYGWTPGLFHSLLTSVQTTSLLALGPKETCSLLCLLNDLFPEEGIWLWRNGMPLMSALRSLAVGSLLGIQKQRQVDWFLEPGCLEKLLGQLKPHLDKIAQIIQHYAISALIVIQDMLRVLIIRVACQKTENACLLLRPILGWIHDHVSDSSSLSDMNVYKVHQLLEFLASLLEHPCAKVVLLKEGVSQMLTKVLKSCFDAIDFDGKQLSDHINSLKTGFTTTSWCLPVFKSLSLLCTSLTPLKIPGRQDLSKFDHVSADDCSLILLHILKFCQVLPVGNELVFCLSAFKDLVSCSEGRSGLISIVCLEPYTLEELDSGGGHERSRNRSLINEFEWRNNPPLLCCWTKMLNSVDSNDGLSTYAVEAVSALSLGSLHFCLDGKSLNSSAIVALKHLFGFSDDKSEPEGFQEENISLIQKMISVLSKINDEYSVTPDMQTTIFQVSELVKALLLLLQKPTGSVEVDDVIFTEGILPVLSNMHLVADNNVEKDDDHLYLVGLEDKFMWECPETLPDRLLQTTLPAKRKMPPVEGLSRRARGENSGAETTQNMFSRGLGPSAAPSAPTRRDTFRHRKPNTSRAPSLHVDDYIAKERSDGVTNSNVIVAQRVGSAGGRAPSVHVDEFMARERERHKRIVTVVGEATIQVKNEAPANDTQKEKGDKPKLLKTELDDDLQGIDIVFDEEESEPDDKLPFPQLDDYLQQPSPIIVEQSSSHSIVEETESDVNERGQISHMGTPLASNADENTQSEFSSRMSVSRSEVQLTREPSVSSDKKFFEQSDDAKNAITANASGGFDFGGAANSPRFSTSLYNNPPGSSMSTVSRMDQIFYPKSSPQHAANIAVGSGSRGPYDQKVRSNQPPLPPMPPPQAISQFSDSISSHSSPYVNQLTEAQMPVPQGFKIQPDYLLAYGGSSTPLSSSHPGGSSRPPLPPTPPPFSSSSYSLPSVKANSQMSMYNQNSAGITDLPQAQSPAVPIIDARLGSVSASAAGPTSYLSPPLMQPLIFNRSASIPASLYGNSPAQQQGENQSILQNLSIPQPSIQSMHSVAPLQPLQPPQVPRPQQPPLHLRPPMQASQQLEQAVSLQNPVQMQMHPSQTPQPPQVSPIHTYYQSQQKEFSPAQQQLQVERAQSQVQHHQGDVGSQQLQDPAISLHEYFKSPEAIQSLLSDRDKLCQLLEQHPKLMQMLQERLGQL